MLLVHRTRIYLLLLALCSDLTIAQQATPASDATVCSTEARLAAGGSFAVAKDGTRIWYKASGRQGALTIVFLHGGPGYNAFVFENSGGKHGSTGSRIRTLGLHFEQSLSGLPRRRLSDWHVPTVARRLGAPTLLIAGRQSHVIGEENIRDASKIWGASVEWIDAGHFVYFEKPKEFAAAIERFVSRLGLSTQSGSRSDDVK